MTADSVIVASGQFNSLERTGMARRIIEHIFGLIPAHYLISDQAGSRVARLGTAIAKE
jgi:hypothetical protein